MAWDVSGGRRLGRPFSAGTTLTMEFENDPSLAISPDGALLAIAETDGTVRVLDAESLRTLEELPAVIGAPVLDVAFSPDGRHLAVAGVGEQIVRLWDVATWTPEERLPGPPIELDGEPLFARSIAFSPDGRFLAAGVGGGQIWLWDAATGKPLGEPITVSEGGILDVGFGPASDVIAAAIANPDSAVGIARTWRLDDRSKLYSVDVDGGYGRASAVAFSPDGRLLVTGGGTGDARFWDAATGARAGASVQASAGWLHTLQFDRAGTSLVTGGGDGTIRLYDPAKRAQIGAPLPGPDNEPPAAVFSPDSSRVFAIYANGRGFAWDISVDSWKSHACRVAGRALTKAEWQQFLPGRPYAPACRTGGAGPAGIGRGVGSREGRRHWPPMTDANNSQMRSAFALALVTRLRQPRSASPLTAGGVRSLHSLSHWRRGCADQPGREQITRRSTLSPPRSVLQRTH
ncbi:MAG: WD40 repeat domain-containing protein, partial [Candidatus Limnocylindria bacterium]